jgi:predicted amidohydrolase YtcJ
MTEWAAYASRLDGTGVIRPGAAADLVFLSADLRKSKEADIQKIRIRTMTDGQWRTR